MLVLNLILIGVAVALDPLPLTAFLVVLPSKRGTVKGAAFVFGWLVSLAIVVTVTVAATGNNPPRPATVPSLASLAIKIALGLVLVRIAIRHIRARGAPKPPKSSWPESTSTRLLAASISRLVRTLAFPLSFLLLGLGFVGILFGRDRRALHDSIAGNTVIYTWDVRAARLRSLARDGGARPPYAR